MQVLEALVTRQVESIDFFHETFFAGLSRKRALNRLGELKAGGFIERTEVLLTGQQTPTSVYWLTRRGKKAVDFRAVGATWYSTRTWKLDPDVPSIPHQICTNRVCDWLRANPVPEHLQPAFKKRDGTSIKHRSDAFYEARKPAADGSRLVLLEVDLGHYNRKRVLEKVHAFNEVREAQFLVWACVTEQRTRQIQKLLVQEFGPQVWKRLDVMSFAEIKAGTTPGHPYARPELLPNKERPWNYDVEVS